MTLFGCIAPSFDRAGITPGDFEPSLLNFAYRLSDFNLPQPLALSLPYHWRLASALTLLESRLRASSPSPIRRLGRGR